MKKIILFFLLFTFRLLSHSQNSASLTFLQGGPAVNFLYTVDRFEGGPLGAWTNYEISNLKPLLGFSSGIIRHEAIHDGPSFFRLGVLASYKVNSADLNYQSGVQYTNSSTAQNIKTNIEIYMCLLHNSNILFINDQD